VKESRRVVGYVACTVLLAVGCLAVALQHSPRLDLRSVSNMAILVMLCVLGLQLMVRRLTPNVDVSVNFIVQLATLVLLGPAAAMVVGGAASLLDLRRARVVVRAFNVALDVVTMAGAALVYVALGGSVGLHERKSAQELLLHVGVPMEAASVTMLVVASVLVGGVVALDTGVPYREVVGGLLRSMLVMYVGYGLFGLLLVVLWGPAQVGPLSAVLVLAPMFVARWAFAQYAEQNAAHERTVAALVSAVEAKDRYTRGHSERVARAAVLIGRTVGLSQQRTSTLHFAGMLHDVGKLGVPTRVLQKSGALTDDEFIAIARHPLRGLEMVREIEFLGEALQGILHHHERLDGRGYPLGLAGDAIPEFARMIAVADAFDSMTSTRSYRQARSVAEALAELEACTGTQFDAGYVQALRHALERTDWEPVTRAPAEAPDTGSVPTGAGVDSGSVPVPVGSGALDHDDPGFDVPHQSVQQDAAASLEAAADIGSDASTGEPGLGEPEFRPARITRRAARRRSSAPRIVRRRRP
jgi:hypothetical protein